VDVALFLIGTSHTLQCASPGVDRAKVEAFESEVRRICAEARIARIVEEMSKAGLKHHEVECTIGARVALDLGLLHQHVDLEPTERAALSLDDGPMLNIVLNHDFPDGGGSFRRAFNALGNSVRERCWIGRMLSRKEWPALFVCGSDHTDSIKSLWQSLGLPITIVHRDYEP
jgi:hypothetical protein